MEWETQRTQTNVKEKQIDLNAGRMYCTTAIVSEKKLRWKCSIANDGLLAKALSLNKLRNCAGAIKTVPVRKEKSENVDAHKMRIEERLQAKF